jgi:pimeloyl-ACP methyl ester carboxylesterase
MWFPNVDVLSKERPVITWDIRGHGRTTTELEPDNFSHEHCARDMLAILDECGASRAAVGGLSLGGYLSLYFTLAHASRVAALLLFDTGPGYKNDEGRAQWNSYAEAQALRLEQDGASALATSPETTLGPQDPAGLALAARGILAQHGAEVIGALHRITVPTLVLVGENDRAFLSAADYMASHIDRSVHVVLANAGHASNIDQPEAFNLSVNDFLSSVR